MSLQTLLTFIKLYNSFLWGMDWNVIYLIIKLSSISISKWIIDFNCNLNEKKLRNQTNVVCTPKFIIRAQVHYIQSQCKYTNRHKFAPVDANDANCAARLPQNRYLPQLRLPSKLKISTRVENTHDALSRKAISEELIGMSGFTYSVVSGCTFLLFFMFLFVPVTRNTSHK